MIDDAQNVSGTGSGVTPFKLWPAQVGVLWDILASRKVVILKARQLGISWLVCWYVLWRCLNEPGQAVMLFSKGQNEANELIRRIRVLYRRLPGWLRDMRPALLAPESKSSISWANGSGVRSMPATPTSGVSYTASLVVMDEAAKMMHGDELYESVKPTVANGNAQLLVLSTADGIGNAFHNIWDGAERGENGFKSIFLPWWARPDRDATFYANELRSSNDPRKIAQEYPSNPTEAFLVSGRPRFDREWFRALYPRMRRALALRELPAWMHEWPEYPGVPRGEVLPVSSVPGVLVYNLPQEGHRYVVAADVAEGKDPTDRADPDYNAGLVLDYDTWEQMAQVHGRHEPDVFARYLMSLGLAYGACPVVPERNNHGHGVIATLKTLRYPLIGLGPDGAFGWPTNVQTKPQGIDLLAECLRDGLVLPHHPPTLNELAYYSVQRNGDTSAPKGKHDDLVMQWYVALSYLRHARSRRDPGPPRAVGERYRLKNHPDPTRAPAPAAGRRHSVPA